MATFTVLYDSMYGTAKQGRCALTPLEIEAKSALAAGWEAIQRQPGPAPIFTAAIKGVAAEGGPFLPWEGHLKDFDPRKPETRAWDCFVSYNSGTEGHEEELNCQVCGATKEVADEIFRKLAAYQPEDIYTGFGVYKPHPHILRLL